MFSVAKYDAKEFIFIYRKPRGFIARSSAFEGIQSKLLNFECAFSRRVPLTITRRPHVVEFQIKRPVKPFVNLEPELTPASISVEVVYQFVLIKRKSRISAYVLINNRSVTVAQRRISDCRGKLSICCPYAKNRCKK